MLWYFLVRLILFQPKINLGEEQYARVVLFSNSNFEKFYCIFGRRWATHVRIKKMRIIKNRKQKLGNLKSFK